MNWLNAFKLGRVAALAWLRSSCAIRASRSADWICSPYFRARANASGRVMVRGGEALAAGVVWACSTGMLLAHTARAISQERIDKPLNRKWATSIGITTGFSERMLKGPPANLQGPLACW